MSSVVSSKTEDKLKALQQSVLEFEEFVESEQMKSGFLMARLLTPLLSLGVGSLLGIGVLFVLWHALK